MGYIHDLGRQLEEKLSALPEDERKEVITFIKNEVFESYRNGLKAQRTKKESA